VNDSSLETEHEIVETIPGQFAWWLRLMLVGPGVVMIGLLITARTLEPSPNGFGTHQGLGLPACTFKSVWGVQCPSCGMTTSWAHTTRGNLVGAVKANPGGMLLAISAAIFGPWMVVSGLKGVWWLRPPNELFIGLGGVAIIAITLIDWFTRRINY